MFSRWQNILIPCNGGDDAEEMKHVMENMHHMTSFNGILSFEDAADYSVFDDTREDPNSNPLLGKPRTCQSVVK